jgi:hypothetical protein
VRCKSAGNGRSHNSYNRRNSVEAAIKIRRRNGDGTSVDEAATEVLSPAELRRVSLMETSAARPPWKPPPPPLRREDPRRLGCDQNTEGKGRQVRAIDLKRIHARRYSICWLSPESVDRWPDGATIYS